MLYISENEVFERLKFDNPWWNGERIEEMYDQFSHRAYFPSFFKELTNNEIRRAVILMGPRRVGKTVMVYQAIQQLIDNGVRPNNILYLSLETPIYTGLSLEKMLRFFLQIHGHTKTEGLYIFFDEIQYLSDWEVHLKSLVDSFRQYQFVATGSAAAALKLKSTESGAGRFTDFLLPPLTFTEFLRFTDLEDVLIKNVNEVNERHESTNILALNQAYIDYINFGGYPEAVFSETIRKSASRYIKSDIIDKVLLRDLPSLYGISNIQELNRLFTAIAYNSGNEISLDGLSKSSGVAKNTLRRYLAYLEAAFLIKRVYRIDQNAKRFKRATTFKVYLINPSMRTALFGTIDADANAIGMMNEGAIYAHLFDHELYDQTWDGVYYARWRSGEVDLVGIGRANQKPQVAIEIKWSDRPAEDYNQIKAILDFAGKNQLDHVIVTTKTITETRVIQDITVTFIPSALLAYDLSRQLFDYLAQ